VRLVNGVADQQQGMVAVNIRHLTDRVGLPSLLVDVRHGVPIFAVSLIFLFFAFL
jgi:hypothetical protein